MSTYYKLLVVLFGFTSIAASSPNNKQVDEASLTLYVKATVNGKQHDFSLNDSFLRLVQAANQDLKTNDPDCFTPAFLRDSRKALPKLTALGGRSVTITATPSRAIHCTFFDRKSRVLLALGAGFPVPRERLLSFVKFFPTYDLLLFDYRGMGCNHTIDISYALPWKWTGLIAWQISKKLDLAVSEIGTQEENDLIPVVDAFKQQKKYANVFGLGICFSSYIFAKATAQRPDLFDKLIFDGCWPSLEKVIKNCIKHPSLLCSFEHPHSPFPFITYSKWAQACGLKSWRTREAGGLTVVSSL
ncbi:MAG: hypothetical protein WCT20_04370 [Candidatus Babeliales bacterium]|jgi:pimeloyl-ACP methyl ester carboxylesterase